jgi:hypothetical protein
MSAKWLGLYAGFFLLVVVLTLVATGVLQQGILPRLTSRAKAAEAEEPAGKAEPGKPEAKADAGTPAGKAEPGKPEAAPALPPADHAEAAPAPGTPAPALPIAEAPRAGAPSKREPPPAARLARVYEGMRPKEAAAVLEQLDRPLAAAILGYVNERQAAKILGALPPKAAAEVMGLLSLAPKVAP